MGWLQILKIKKVRKNVTFYFLNCTYSDICTHRRMKFTRFIEYKCPALTLLLKTLATTKVQVCCTTVLVIIVPWQDDLAPAQGVSLSVEYVHHVSCHGSNFAPA